VNAYVTVSGVEPATSTNVAGYTGQVGGIEPMASGSASQGDHGPVAASATNHAPPWQRYQRPSHATSGSLAFVAYRIDVPSIGRSLGVPPRNETFPCAVARSSVARCTICCW
jgi:hypothetical protein